MPEELFIDLETYCDLDIKKVGAHRYVEHPSFRIRMASYALDDDPVRVLTDLDDIRRIPHLFDRRVAHVAHNAGFERVALSGLAGLPARTYLDPELWHDTQAIAAELGYPQKLERLAVALGVAEKDYAGTRLINLWSKPQRRLGGRMLLPEEKPDEWLEFVAYSHQDTVTLREVHRALGGWPTDHEREVWIVDQLINDRGMLIDTELVDRAIEVAESNAEELTRELAELTGVENPNSIPQLSEGMRRLGLKLPNLQAETIEAKLETPGLNDRQRRALEIRAELAGSAIKKYPAAQLAVCDDGRIRGGFVFFGAHTGRWTGRRVQPQNLPRASLWDEDLPDEVNEANIEAAVLDVKLGLGADQYALKALVRSMFTAELGTLAVVDYAAIEARVIAWLAGEQWAIDAFEAGRDIYVETAARMSTPGNQLTRAQGKVAVLALGYNGGINSLRNMGAEGTDDELQALVDTWRKANPRIVRFWRDLGEAFKRGGRAGRVRVRWVGRDRHMVLPSGRAIVYRDVNPAETFIIPDPETGRKRKKIAPGFADPGERRGNGRTLTYGGKLAENATQAVARDLLAAALVRLEHAGYSVVAHVHDEVIVEGDDVEGIRQLMCVSPSWAAGLPVAAEGFTTTRYRKG